MSPDLPTLPGYMFDPSWQGIVSLALTVILPIVVGLLTTSKWAPIAKSLLLLVLAAGKAIGEAFLAHDFGLPVVYAIVANLIIAVAMYLAFYRVPGPSGTSLADWAATRGVTAGAEPDTVYGTNGEHASDAGNTPNP